MKEIMRGVIAFVHAIVFATTLFSSVATERDCRPVSGAAKVKHGQTALDYAPVFELIRLVPARPHRL